MTEALVTSLRSALRADPSASLVLTKSKRNDSLNEATRAQDVATLFMRHKNGFGNETAGNIQRACEHLGLFSLLARLNLQAWRDEVANAWEEIELDADEAVRRKKPFRFGLELKAAATFLLLVLATGDETVTPAYDELFRRAAPHLLVDVNDPNLKVPIRVVLDFKWAEKAPEQRLTDELQAILQVFNAIDSRTSASSLQAFRIQEVWINNKFELKATQETLDVMKNLVECGIQVRDLPCIPQLDRTCLLEALQELVPSRSAPAPSIGVSTLVVSDSSWSQSIAAVMSSLVTSTNVRRVDLQYSRRYKAGDRKAFWRWVAYAVFSRDAIHGVKHIHLEPRRIAVQDIELMREVLEAEDPLATLLGEERDASTDNIWLRASRFAFAAPGSGGEQEAVDADFTSKHPLVVPVIKQVVGGWSVLLPGYGKAWVREGEGEVVARPGRVPTVQCQKWTVSAKLGRRGPEDTIESVEATVALLSLVGNLVDCIHLTKSSLSNAALVGEREEWLEDIISSCPHLRELTIGDVGIESLNVFVDFPEAHMLQKLVFKGPIDVTNDVSNVSRFLEVLADPSHPLATSLQHLELTVELNDGPSEDFVNLVRSAWEQSTRLQTMIIRIAFHDDMEEAEMIIEDPFFELQNQSKEQFVILPPTAATKIGFLSVLPFVAKREALDSGIISTIFALAAIRRTRDFWFEVL